MRLSEQNLDSFLTVIYKRYGYDFSGYARKSFLRRLNRFMDNFHFPNLEMLSDVLTADEGLFNTFLQEITVNVTEMFRDPPFYRALREKVFPELKTYPHVRIWDAGCSTGEETYSLAILLHEESLKAKSRIYATDINANNGLRKEQEATSPML
jgi:chemotaxis protein methyltransferase CheR